MWQLVTVQVKGNATWADDATRRTSNTIVKSAPWNLIMVERGSILVSPLGNGNKDYITTDMLSPIRYLETKL